MFFAGLTIGAMFVYILVLRRELAALHRRLGVEREAKTELARTSIPITEFEAVRARDREEWETERDKRLALQQRVDELEQLALSAPKPMQRRRL